MKTSPDIFLALLSDALTNLHNSTLPLSTSLAVGQVLSLADACFLLDLISDSTHREYKELANTRLANLTTPTPSTPH